MQEILERLGRFEHITIVVFEERVRCIAMKIARNFFTSCKLIAER